MPDLYAVLKLNLPEGPVIWVNLMALNAVTPNGGNSKIFLDDGTTFVVTEDAEFIAVEMSLYHQRRDSLNG